jgi:hypothetical protein
MPIAQLGGPEGGIIPPADDGAVDQANRISTSNFS